METSQSGSESGDEGKGKDSSRVWEVKRMKM